MIFDRNQPKTLFGKSCVSTADTYRCIPGQDTDCASFGSQIGQWRSASTRSRQPCLRKLPCGRRKRTGPWSLTAANPPSYDRLGLCPPDNCPDTQTPAAADFKFKQGSK